MRFVPAVVIAGLCCLHGQSLETLWKLPLQAPPAGPPVVFANGAVVTLANGRIAVVDPQGREVASARMDQGNAEINMRSN